MKRAKIFISCGQRDDREKKFGEYLVNYLTPKYEVFLAEEVHNSKPLLQSIFNELRTSEYFIAFNPFRKDTGKVGSIFVQQEIAMAALQKLPSLYFCEKGVSKKIGVSGGLHLNGIEISKPIQMKNHLDKVIKRWPKKSKYKLFLKFGNIHKNVTVNNHVGSPSNWSHIIVENKHADLHAQNCRGYIERIYDLNNKSEINFDYKPELVWAGTGIHTISITSNSKRDLDALWTFQGSGNWQTQFLQTSTLYSYPVLNDGKYRIHYSVVSDNFQKETLQVDLELSNDSISILKQKQL